MRMATSVLVLAATACAVLASIDQCPKDAKCCPLENGGCSIQSTYCLLDAETTKCGEGFSLREDHFGTSKMLGTSNAIEKADFRHVVCRT
ncbi:hypothetical protein RUM44_007044 [Polyplax serrata]|uniref:Uncharacterized protein n=1 Tax=Polyplax serrata TaxID=468196 RepID=A0ABR1B181_POLSC